MQKGDIFCQDEPPHQIIIYFHILVARRARIVLFIYFLYFKGNNETLCCVKVKPIFFSFSNRYTQREREAQKLLMKMIVFTLRGILVPLHRRPLNKGGIVQCCHLPDFLTG